MARKSAKPGDEGGYRIAPLQIATDRFPAQENVSISLRFYDPKVQCFSAWDRDEMKRFSALVSKLKNLPLMELKANGRLCKAHFAPARKGGYLRPEAISKDVKLYELKADRGLRVHGVFQGPIFHLFWLDRNHEYYG